MEGIYENIKWGKSWLDCRSNRICMDDHMFYEIGYRARFSNELILDWFSNCDYFQYYRNKKAKEK